MYSENILKNIRKIIRALNLESKKIQKEFGLSMSQLLVLHHLKQAPEEQLTQKELCETLNLSRSTVTGIIDRMEKKELVKRLPNINDRRTNYVGLTAKSHDLLKKAPDPIQNVLIRKLEEAPETQQVMISNSLQHLTEFLGIEKLEAAPLLLEEELSKQDSETKTTD